MKKMITAYIAIAVLVVVGATTVALLQVPQLGQNTSTTTHGSTSTTGQQAGTGQFALVATDPPITAQGVTSASINYNAVAVHRADANDSSGWTQVSGSGSMNLMSSTSVGQTIASDKVQAGSYDKIRLDVTSAKVTYKQHDYNCAVASSTLTFKAQNNVKVNSSATTTALIDFKTFIVNTGNASSPLFVFSATAKATTVPPSEVTSAWLQVGAQTSLQGKAWFNTFEQQTSTKLELSSVVLMNGQLGFHAQNSGNDTADMQTVIVTPVSASATTTTTATLPAYLSGSAVFTVDSAGSLQASNSFQAAALLTTGGSRVSAGSTISLSFNGIISLDFGLGSLHLSGIVSGQQYLVTVIGANTYASTVVVAS
ncbi:MAG: DUF4382 domain-containing protein [Thaumarchaeota archaeon]|nr:DUF4382 domain-containing protein [Nitrososphaerota archaeon]